MKLGVLNKPFQLRVVRRLTAHSFPHATISHFHSNFFPKEGKSHLNILLRSRKSVFEQVSTFGTVILSILVSLLVSSCAEEQVYREIDPEIEGGSGKIYLGREIADVMVSESSYWLDRPERDLEELPTRLLRSLDLTASAVVADIGSGTGFFAFRLAELVPSGRVYAVEVQPELVDTLQVRADRMGVRNVMPILGTIKDPSLPPNRIDLALIVSSYHEFSYPKEMISSIVQSLNPDGRLVIVEYRGEDATIPIAEAHRMSEAQIILEMESVGLRFRETKDVLPQQHVVVFSLASSGDN